MGSGTHVVPQGEVCASPSGRETALVVQEEGGAACAGPGAQGNPAATFSRASTWLSPCTSESQCFAPIGAPTSADRRDGLGLGRLDRARDMSREGLSHSGSLGTGRGVRV